MSTTVQKLTRQRDAHQVAAAAVQKQIDAARGRQKLLCHHCGKRSTVNKTIYIQPYWYERPYGCTGGARWLVSDEGRFACLHCGWENRFWPTPRYGGAGNRGWICDLKDHFAKVVKVYTEGNGQERTEDWQWRDRPGWCN